MDQLNLAALSCEALPPSRAAQGRVEVKAGQASASFDCTGQSKLSLEALGIPAGTKATHMRGKCAVLWEAMVSTHGTGVGLMARTQLLSLLRRDILTDFRLPLPCPSRTRSALQILGSAGQGAALASSFPGLGPPACPAQLWGPRSPQKEARLLWLGPGQRPRILRL